jgi:hypothetical protein
MMIQSTRLAAPEEKNRCRSQAKKSAWPIRRRIGCLPLVPNAPTPRLRPKPNPPPPKWPRNAARRIDSELEAATWADAGLDVAAGPLKQTSRAASTTVATSSPDGEKRIRHIPATRLPPRETGPGALHAPAASSSSWPRFTKNAPSAPARAPDARDLRLLFVCPRATSSSETVNANPWLHQDSVDLGILMGDRRRTDAQVLQGQAP